jgi:hypothetical protein
LALVSYGKILCLKGLGLGCGPVLENPCQGYKLVLLLAKKIRHLESLEVTHRLKLAAGRAFKGALRALPGKVA